jgi:hypothetical protein
MLCFGSSAAVRHWKDSQMGASSADGYLCWTIAVALILNPCTGHVKPHFHVVYDDNFTTVPYLRTATVPPHWAKLVRPSSAIALYTEHEVGTWQSIPELDVNPGDFTSDTTNTDTAPSTTSTQNCEGDDGHSEGASDLVSHHKNTVTK